MSRSQAAEQLEARGSRLPGRLLPARLAAMSRFDALGLPARDSELWRYTDLSPLAAKALDYLGGPPPAEAVAAAAEALALLALDSDLPRLVFVDGYCVESLSFRPEVPGLSMASLGEHPEALLRDGTADEPALVALNRALARDGALIQSSGSDGAARLAIVCIGSGRGIASQLGFRVELGRDASLQLSEYRIDLAGAGDAWLNTVLDIEQAEGSRLELQKLQRHAPTQYATGLTRVRLAAGASFRADHVEAGGRLVRSETEVLLGGPGADASISGLSLLRDNQHCDSRIAIDHRAPRTTSRQNFRSIAADRSRSVFNGKVTVREQAQQIDARQRNDNLLLSPRAEIDTKPELEIYADQVACSHGATVGEIDEEQLFYLRSRGVGEDAARAILTTAFAAVILEQLPERRFREQAEAAVSAWLTASGSRRESIA